MNEDLAELGKTFERPPTLLDLLYHSKVSLSKYAEKFDSLTALHETAGFETETVIPSNADLLSDLASVAESLGHPPTIGEYDMHGEYRFTTLIRRFDDWLAALNAAGLNSLALPLNTVRIEEREVDRVRFETQLRVSTGLGKPEVLIDELYRLANEFGGVPTPMLIERYSLYPESEFDSAFGSVGMACERAGLCDDQSVDIQSIEYRERLTSELSSLARKFGHHPTPRLVNACASSPVLSFVTTFGSWERALEASFDQPNPPGLAKPFVEAELKDAIEQLGTVSRKETTPLIQALPEECTYEDLNIMFSSIDDAIAQGGETIGEDRESDPEDDRQEDRQSASTTKNQSNTDANRSITSDGQHTTKPSRQALINELHQVNETIEGPLKAGHMQSEGRFSVHHYTDTFGSWEQALKGAAIDRSAQLLTEIERVAEQLGRSPSQTEMNARGKVSAGMVTSHFGSWEDALKQTSLGISNGASQLTSDQTKDRTSDSLNGKEGQSPKSEVIEDSTDDKEEEEQSVSTSKSQSSIDADSSATNRDKLLATLQSVYESVSRLPKRDDLEGTQFSMHDYVSTFGNWEAALEAAGIDKRAILISELERVAKKLDRKPTTSDMDDLSPYWGSTYSEYFGGWNAALEAASLPDLDELDGEPLTIDEDTAEPDRQALIDELHQVNEAVEGPIKSGHMQLEGRFSAQRYIDTFSSWKQALEAADIDYGAQLLAEVERVAEQLGHSPSKTEMDIQGKVSAMTPANYFGGWGKVLEQTNLDTSDEALWPENRAEKTNQTEVSSTGHSETPQNVRTNGGSGDNSSGKESCDNAFESQLNTDVDNSATDRDELMATLQSVHERRNRLPRRDDLEDTQFTMRNYVSTFGSWEAALEAAGIDQRSILISELERVARKLNREPTPSDMTDQSPYPEGIYSQYFDSWDAALEATSLPDFGDLDELIEWVVGEKSSTNRPCRKVL